MASPSDRNPRIQMKHVLIALVAILTTLLFIASIVLISIGYMNPFGTIGLGILGGGCVVFFSAVLLLCASSIWIKNKYYPDEMDYGQKLVGGSVEDLQLLKPAAHVSSLEHHDNDLEKVTISQGDDSNPVPLTSVSTVFSSVSSSASIFSDNWQRNDASRAVDSDVFSSSLTASQLCDLKSQPRLELNDPNSDPPATEQSTQIYGGQRRRAHGAATDNRDDVTEPSQHRKSVDIIHKTQGLPSSPYYAPQRNYDKQDEKRQRTISEDNTLSEKNVRGGPMTNLQTASSAIAKDYKDDRPKGGAAKYFQDSNQQQHTQATNRHRSPIPDFAMLNTRKLSTEGIISDKHLGDLDKKHRSRENIEQLSEDRSDIPLQYLLPKNNHAKRKVQFAKEALKPTNP